MERRTVGAAVVDRPRSGLTSSSERIGGRRADRPGLPAVPAVPAAHRSVGTWWAMAVTAVRRRSGRSGRPGRRADRPGLPAVPAVPAAHRSVGTWWAMAVTAVVAARAPRPEGHTGAGGDPWFWFPKSASMRCRPTTRGWRVLYLDPSPLGHRGRRATPAQVATHGSGSRSPLRCGVVQRQQSVPSRRPS